MTKNEFLTVLAYAKNYMNNVESRKNVLEGISALKAGLKDY